MSQNVNLSIIIVSFNTKDLLMDCVKSVVETVKEHTYEIIVVDNASGDDSVAEIKKSKIKNLNLIENKENFGFSKANNIGIKESKGEFVLFLNSDTIVSENTIDGMVNFMKENPDCGAATCYVRMTNGKLDDASHRGFPTPFRSLAYFSGLAQMFPKSKLLAGYNMTYRDLTKTHQIDALAGAFMMTRREAGQQVGWWDEDYFFYGEDIDFCFKLKEVGWKIYFVPEFEILHYKGVSHGMKKESKHITTATKETKKRAVDARFNAMKIFYKKHYAKKYPFFVNWIVMSGINTKAILTKRSL